MFTWNDASWQIVYLQQAGPVSWELRRRCSNCICLLCPALAGAEACNG